MYVYIYIYIHIYIYVCIYTYIHIYIHICRSCFLHVPPCAMSPKRRSRHTPTTFECKRGWSLQHSHVGPWCMESGNSSLCFFGGGGCRGESWCSVFASSSSPLWDDHPLYAPSIVIALLQKNFISCKRALYLAGLFCPNKNLKQSRGPVYYRHSMWVVKDVYVPSFVK